jgi:hypothetical protein
MRCKIATELAHLGHHLFGLAATAKYFDKGELI